MSFFLDGHSVGEVGYITFFGTAMFTIQPMPNLSVHMPNVSPQMAFSRGMGDFTAGREFIEEGLQFFFKRASPVSDRQCSSRDGTPCGWECRTPSGSMQSFAI